MKKIVFAFVVLILFVSSNIEGKHFRPGVNFNFFYAQLSPYGEWIEIDYDVFVWRPTYVHYNWQPYSLGRWAWTPYGWYWDSYEPFGWATYHYGRWFYDDYYGWVWMPDYEWGPSWVEWRYDNDYIGWAPLPPYARFKVGVGIHFSISWRSHYRHWHFVRYGHFCHSNVNYYFIDNSHTNYIFNRTKYRTNYYYNNDRIINGGIDRDFVERRSGTKIRTRDLVTTTKLRDYSGGTVRSDDRIEIYKPTNDEVNKYRNIEKRDIIKSDGRTSLRIDKIEKKKSYNKNDKIRKDNSSKRNLKEKYNKKTTDRFFKKDIKTQDTHTIDKHYDANKRNQSTKGIRNKKSDTKNKSFDRSMSKNNTGFEKKKSESTFGNSNIRGNIDSKEYKKKSNTNYKKKDTKQLNNKKQKNTGQKRYNTKNNTKKITTNKNKTNRSRG